MVGFFTVQPHRDLRPMLVDFLHKSFNLYSRKQRLLRSDGIIYYRKFLQLMSGPEWMLKTYQFSF